MMSAFLGSTATCSKYHPRPQRPVSADTRVHVAPASSERKKPPCIGGPPPRPPPPTRPGVVGSTGAAAAPTSGTRQSTTAYTRRGLLGATVIPVLPIPSRGNPTVSCFQEPPPS